MKQRHDVRTALQRLTATNAQNGGNKDSARPAQDYPPPPSNGEISYRGRNSVYSIILPLLLLFTCILPLQSATGEYETSFFPIWKLLQQKEKKVFLSGYQKGLQDSRKIMNIVREHIQQNPQSALESLDKINELYQTAELPIEDLLQGVAVFYSNPENHDAPLSVAFSASKERLR